MIKQIHLIYSGQVQGIGFRYAVLEIAGEQKVCGWVKNLDNGQVEIIAQADEEVLNIFSQKINQQFFNYIKDFKIDWLPAGEFRDFQIKF